MSSKAIRGRLLSFKDDPYRVGEAESFDYWPNGLLILEDGRIDYCGEATALPSDMPIEDHGDHLVMVTTFLVREADQDEVEAAIRFIAATGDRFEQEVHGTDEH